MYSYLLVSCVDLRDCCVRLFILIQLFRLCCQPIALHTYRTEFLLTERSFSPIRKTLKRFCVRLRLIVLLGIWAAAIVLQLWALFPRLFKVSKVLDLRSKARLRCAIPRRCGV